MSQFFVNSAGGVSPTGDLHVAKWIVNSSGAGSGGNQTTIQAAITAASAGDTIFIMPGATGIYTENLTLKAGVNIVAFRGDEEIPNVTIVGTMTMTTAGIVSVSNIRLQTNGSFFLSVTGSAASIVNLENCYFNMTNNTGINFTSSNSSAAIKIDDCNGNIVTTGIALFSSSSAGSLIFNYLTMNNTGGSTTANTISAGGIHLEYCTIVNPITTSGTAAIFTSMSIIDTGIQNVTSLTHGGSGLSNVNYTTFGSGTASAVSISATLQMFECTINSTNTNAVTGAGTITYSGISFSNTSTTINTTTQTNCGTLQGSKNTAPSAGFLGEQIRSAVTGISMSSGVATSLTSINVTPGVWAITASSTIVFSDAGNRNDTGISTTNNTIQGNLGDQYVSTNLGSTVTSPNIANCVPSFVVTLNTTTTYYLVCVGGVFTGTITGNGRISAIRVG
jgi:hypothetical protein